MKKRHIIYIAAFFALSIVPSLGMTVTKQEASSENRTLAEFPSVKTEEGYNINWLSEAGTYFQEHFAFRNELVTANALLKGRLLGVSTADGVIQGTDGWLYYKDSLSDYLGTELLSDRSLYNIAHTLSMMKEALQEKKIDFLFTVAMNKNSLYDENMPYYDKQKISDEKNYTNLKKYLEKEQVSYADMYDVFLEKEEILYHKRDSHWNNKGAAAAADIMLTVLGKEHDSYENESYTVKNDFEGDLDKMLYPLALTPEEEIYYDKQTTYAYVGEVESNFDPRIVTVNPVKEGSLVMFRDSFGNAILPFLADAYQNAYFSRGVPYQMDEVDNREADTVIVERAERFLPEMAQSPPVQKALERNCTVTSDDTREMGALDVQETEMGIYLKITGRILPEYMDTESRIYVRVNNDRIYEAFPMDMKLEDGTVDSNGFCLYLEKESLAVDGNSIEILIGDGQTAHVVDNQLF